MSRYAEYAAGRDEDAPRYSAEHVRMVRAEDAPAVARLSADRDGLVLAEISEPVRRDVEACLSGAEQCVFVADVEGQVVGYGRAKRLSHEQHGLPAELPEGWYLNGVVVDPAHRRRGLGHALTAARLAWVRERADAAHYVTNQANRVSIELHAELGFAEIARGFDYPRAGLSPDEGIAFRVSLG